MNTNIGEVIPVIWDSTVEAYYIRGHIDPDEARKTLNYDFAWEPDEPFYQTNVQHIWAKWVKVGADHPDAFDCEEGWIFRTSKEKRRGYFAVTELTPQ